MDYDTLARRFAQEFGGWNVDALLGEGGFGRVYRIARSRFGVAEYSAMKIVNLIPYGDAVKGWSKREIALFKQQLQENDLKEVVLMKELAGNTNIVDVQDWDVKDWTEGDLYGCHLVIRMELLRSLESIMHQQESLSEKEVAKIGTDICGALTLCHAKGIVHRDIKPGNIFRNNAGAYKLGDFGLSRITAGGRASTQAGTPLFAAPEQFGDAYQGKYGMTVDIYSLGMTLYWLLNGNLPPFVSSSVVSNRVVQEAEMKRISGTPLPPPKKCSARLAGVIQKACAFKPADRYQSAKEFREAIEAAVLGATGRQVGQQQGGTGKGAGQQQGGAGKGQMQQGGTGKGTGQQFGAGLSPRDRAIIEERSDLCDRLNDPQNWSYAGGSEDQKNAQAEFAEAEKLYQAGDLIRALPHYRETDFLLDDEDEAAALYPYLALRLAECYAAVERGDDAQLFYDMAVDRIEGNPLLQDDALKEKIKVLIPEVNSSALECAKDKVKTLIALQKPHGKYQAGDADQYFADAEKAFVKKQFSEAGKWYQGCIFALGCKEDVPAYLCWRMMECNIGLGDADAARFHYDQALKQMPALRDPVVEKTLNDLAAKNVKELERIRAEVAKIGAATRERWQKELLAAFDRYESAHPVSFEDKLHMRECAAIIQKGLHFNRPSVDRLRNLAVKTPRASYLLGQDYALRGMTGTIHFETCGKTLGAYPAGLCVEALDVCIRGKTAVLGKTWYERLKTAAPNLR